MNRDSTEPAPQTGTDQPTKYRDNDGLHKRGDRWHYKLKINGKWREFSTKTTNYKAAKRIRHEKIQQQREGRLPTDAARATLKAVSPHWLEQRKHLVAHQTWRIDKERMKPLVKRLGEMRLGDISNDAIRAYQTARVADVSSRTVNLEIKVLRQILKPHKLWARLADDYKPLPENREGPGRALTPEQEKTLLSTAGSRPGWQAAYYAALLASNTTARACELKGLRLQDVDLMEPAITIRRVSTKTNAGVRKIPLNDAARWAAAKAFERAALLGAEQPEHYLFPACQRQQIDVSKPQKTWRTAWRKLTKAAGLSGLRFHDLRHHAVTRLAEAGVPEQTLMAIAGHISREMLEHYSHIRTQAKRDAVNAIVSFRPEEEITVQDTSIN